MIANDEETDIVSNMDINETNAGVPLNQKECGDFFTNKKDQLKSITSEEEKNMKRRNIIGRVVSGRAITENGVAKKQQEPTENVGKNKSITTKPQSVKSKPTWSNLVKLKKKKV